MNPNIDRSIKRLLDIVLSLLMIVLFAPIFIVLTAYICTVYKVPPIFRHTRVGQNGKRFSCFKFRTMVPDADERLAKMLANDPDLQAEWDATQKLSNDPRILPGVGSLLRKASLDELPQVFNVLLGHMSMVGPRPITENELGFYGEYTEHYMSVRPGITGAWQIAGRSSTSYDDRVSIDVWYVENANLRVDVYIFLKTVFSFCSGRLSGGV